MPPRPNTRIAALPAQIRDVSRFPEADRPAVQALLDSYAKRKIESPETVAGYVRSLHSIASKCLSKQSGRTSLVQSIANDTDGMRRCLRSKVRVLSTYVTLNYGIIALFKHAPGHVPGGHEVQAFWRIEQRDAHAALKVQNKHNVVAPDKRNKEFVLSELDEPIAKARADVSRGGPSSRSTAPWTENQQLLWLVIAKNVPPHRRDYGAMRIVRTLREVIDGENAMVVPRSGAATLVLGNYKTVKHYKRFEQRMPAEVSDEIRRSLHALPRKYLFVKRDMQPMGDEYFGFWARNAFEKYLGKPVTVNSLRRAWVTWISNPENKLTIAEREQYAKEMNHSLDMQFMRYTRVDR
jgi:hypothetical protein